MSLLKAGMGVLWQNDLIIKWYSLVSPHSTTSPKDTPSAVADGTGLPGVSHELDLELAHPSYSIIISRSSLFNEVTHSHLDSSKHCGVLSCFLRTYTYCTICKTNTILYCKSYVKEAHSFTWQPFSYLEVEIGFSWVCLSPFSLYWNYSRLHCCLKLTPNPRCVWPVPSIRYFLPHC